MQEAGFTPLCRVLGTSATVFGQVPRNPRHSQAQLAFASLAVPLLTSSSSGSAGEGRSVRHCWPGLQTARNFRMQPGTVEDRRWWQSRGRTCSAACGAFASSCSAPVGSQREKPLLRPVFTLARIKPAPAPQAASVPTPGAGCEGGASVAFQSLLYQGGCLFPVKESTGVCHARGK